LRVYIAGPYTKGDVAVNVAIAVDAGTKVADAGHHPFIPHLSHFWHYRNVRPYEFWLDQDMAWLRVSEALIRLPGESSGADKEVAEAERLGIPVFYSAEDFLGPELNP
jgi:hypothetical protein